MPSILVENKADLLPENERNNTKDLKEFANTNNFTESFRTSAKTGLNINESMDFLIQNILSRLSKIHNELSPDDNSISISPETHLEVRKPQNKGCC